MYDAIVVLAGGVQRDGGLSLDVRSRIERGVNLLCQGAARWLILTGRWGFLETTPPRLTEAEAMRRLAFRLGVPPQQTLKEERSQDTIGNAFFTKVRYFEPRGWRRIAVVTADFHIKRSRYVFRKILGPSYQLSFIAAPSRLSLQLRRKIDFRETALLALTKYWLEKIPDGATRAFDTLLTTKHPAYSRSPVNAGRHFARFVEQHPRYLKPLKSLLT